MCVFQVEGLMDDIDFKSKVTRAEFEHLCADLFERVPRPVQDALTSAEMKLVSILCAWRQVSVCYCRLKPGRSKLHLLMSHHRVHMP